MEREDVRVYVAGPLTALPEGYLQNIHRMAATCNDIRHAGLAPFNPGADLVDGIISGDVTVDEFKRVSLAWLRAAHIVYRMDGVSPGSDAEVALAEELDIPVVYDFLHLEKLARALTGGGHVDET